MDEKETSQGNKKNVSQYEQQNVHVDGDFALGTLLDMMILSGVHVDITLLCNGMMVSGTPMGDAQFFKRFNDSIDEIRSTAPLRPVGDVASLGPEPEKQLEQQRDAFITIAQNLFSSFGETADVIVKARYDWTLDDKQKQILGDEEVSPVRGYVCLENVTIKDAAGEYHNLPMWRGRLGFISGWFLGRMVPNT